MKHFKIICILFILFFLDLIHPFANALNVDFLLLGVIFLGINWRLKHSLPIAFFFGCTKDAFLPANSSFNFIELPLLCLGISYCISIFLFIQEKTKNLIKVLIVFFALLMHCLFLVTQPAGFIPFFTLQFLLQSFFLYLFLDFIFRKWVLLNKSSILR